MFFSYCSRKKKASRPMTATSLTSCLTLTGAPRQNPAPALPRPPREGSLLRQIRKEEDRQVLWLEKKASLPQKRSGPPIPGILSKPSCCRVQILKRFASTTGGTTACSATIRYPKCPDILSGSTATSRRSQLPFSTPRNPERGIKSGTD